jgi:hypothetical protein
MSVLSFFNEYSIIITTVSEAFTAIGTVGAVIVALWLSNKDSKPKLKVHATIGILTPSMSETIWITCTNEGKLPIMCSSFAFAPCIKKSPRIMLTQPLLEICMPMPKLLNYSERVDQNFDVSALASKAFCMFLDTDKMMTRHKLKNFWRVIVNTNVGSFEGTLSDDLIEKIISLHFPTPTDATLSQKTAL